MGMQRKKLDLAPVQSLKLLFQHLSLREDIFNLEYSKKLEKSGIPSFFTESPLLPTSPFL